MLRSKIPMRDSEIVGPPHEPEEWGQLVPASDRLALADKTGTSRPRPWFMVPMRIRLSELEALHELAGRAKGSHPRTAVNPLKHGDFA